MALNTTTMKQSIKQLSNDMTERETDSTDEFASRLTRMFGAGRKGLCSLLF
jgi:hypothetical protein